MVALAACLISMPAAQGQQSIAAPPSAIVGAPLPGMDFESQSIFRLGRAVFRRNYTPAGEGDASFDGLGPLMNAASCVSCHVNDGRGAPPEPGGGLYDNVSMILKITTQGATARPSATYGSQLQDIAVRGTMPEGRIGVTYERTMVTYSDGSKIELRHPRFFVQSAGYGPLEDNTRLLPRIAPPVFGLGLLASIPVARLALQDDPDDMNGDGISGRVRIVQSAQLGGRAPGRFGWKSDKATLADQTAAALGNDMGLSSPLVGRPYGDCTPDQQTCLAMPNGESPQFENLEVHSAPFAWLIAYAEAIAPPDPRPGAGDQSSQVLFENTGCSACHTPAYHLPANDARPYLGGLVIRPYSDLLLHDMGPGLADPPVRQGSEANTAPGEWRTPPLWGVGLSEAINGHSGLLHDGRARNIEEAILWHDGEGKTSRDTFMALTAAERQRLIAFVATL